MKKKTRKKRRKFAEFLIRKDLESQIKKQIRSGASRSNSVMFDSIWTHIMEAPVVSLEMGSINKDRTAFTAENVILKGENEMLKSKVLSLKEQISDLNIINNNQRLKLNSCNKENDIMKALLENRNLNRS